MANINPHNLPTQWAAHFVDALASLGLKHVVISPGSRSTPLTLAFAQHPDIQKHVVLDERSAGFIALGIGLESGTPAALVCTSGTAVANYLPAVIEAKMSGVPMMVLSADRPPMHRNIGANQAIDQSNLFGGYSVFYTDVGEPKEASADMTYIKMIAKQAFANAIQFGGAAHINFPFRKPLEPDTSFFEQLPSFYKQLATKRHILAQEKITFTLPVAFYKMLSRANKPVIIAGPLQGNHHLAQISKHLQELGVPILIEAGGMSDRISNTGIAGFNSFLKDAQYREALTPDLIIRIGAMPTGKGLDDYLVHHKTVQNIWLGDPLRWSNTHLVDQISIPVTKFDVLDEPIVPTNKQWINWLNTWNSVSEQFLKNRKKMISSEVGDLTDGSVYTTLGKHIGNQTLFVSNSFPARDIDNFGLPELGNRKIFMNRGASGIDGVTSTALGVALSNGSDNILLTGDLAFLHDINALLTANKTSSCNLTIVVINNEGGSIFRMLPVYQASDWFTNYFETPQKAQIDDLCKGFGIEYLRVTTQSELSDAFSSLTKGIKVIECKTDPSLSMKQRKSLEIPVL
jgi:2-succinyl-5-enolpyruvyl-6-hydroxy-3-cyclohexene-1-carboxylate synthase